MITCLQKGVNEHGFPDQTNCSAIVLTDSVLNSILYPISASCSTSLSLSIYPKNLLITGIALMVEAKTVAE